MQKGLPFYSIFFAILLVPAILSAQEIKHDSSFLKEAVSGAVSSYNEAVGMQAHLYNGAEYYAPVMLHVEGHQFFGNNTFTKGTILFDGTWFSDVPLLYDVATDKVITLHQASGYSQALVKQKVGVFVLNDHIFIHLKADSLAGLPMQPGFYDLLHDGTTKLLVKRKKELQEQATPQGIEGNYDIVDKFYIQKDGKYYQVKSRASVLKVLRDEKKQLSKFIRANKLRFKKQREEAMLKTAEYYNTLKQ